MSNYLTEAARRVANPTQQERLDSRQVENSAGGFVYAVSKWTSLDRFLILGSCGGSYYATERDLTKENVTSVQACIKEDGLRVVKRVVEISDAGRAPKNDPALFVLALCSKAEDQKVRGAAFDALPKVARIGTHLFHFAEFRTQLGAGWGKGIKRAVASWYLGRSPIALQNQLVKYQARDGWSHRDLLKLAHVNPGSAFPEQKVALAWAAEKTGLELARVPLIQAFEQAKTLKGVSQTNELIGLIQKHELTREMIPTEQLKSAAVWEALLEKMPITALIRNLANMTRSELLKPMSEASKLVVKKLTDTEALKNGRVHPIQLLTALMTYQAGRGVRSRGEGWIPVQKVVDALDEAFYLSFKNVEPTGKRWYLGLDVSGSMSSGEVGGVIGLTPRMASSAMAMVTARTESEHVVRAFSDAATGRRIGKKSVPSMHSGSYYGNRYDTTMVPIDISPKQRLDDIVKKTDGLPFGGTDCALPMLDALEDKIPVDVFVVYTDSETWAGNIHPVKALEMYRQKMSISAKLIVVGMVSNQFSIADPADGGMLDVVGFDTNVPVLMSDFVKN